jgi:putative peptidoglycan lipid II flippase
MDRPHDLLRTNVAVAAGTAVSRVTGLARIVVFGIIIGQTAVADAYDGANNSPNSLYELLIGGVFSAALVPVFTRLFHDHDSESERAVFSTAVVALAALTAIAVAAAPLIFRLFSLNPSNVVDVDQYRDVGTMLARVFLVQIFFYGVTALASAALNARRRFVAAAWAPVASNIVVIALLALIPMAIDGRPSLDTIQDDSTVRWLLGTGSTLGIATTSLIVLLIARRAGLSVGLRPNFRHPAVRRLARLSMWTFGYVLTNQIALVTVRNLAEPGSGGPDAYTKAFTFFQLPHALLAVSIATTFAPELARAAAGNDRGAFVGRLSLGVRLITLLTLPFTVLLAVTARPIVGAVLQHGNFTAQAAYETARALTGFSVGLVGFSVYLFVLRGFYAHEDTRTPFAINLFENALNIALAIVLVGRHGVLGLGLAFGIAYLVSAVVALFVVERRYPEFASLALIRSLAPMLVSALVACVAAWAMGRAVGATAGVGALARTTASFVVGGAVYVGTLKILRVPETASLVERIRRFSAAR